MEASGFFRLDVADHGCRGPGSGAMGERPRAGGTVATDIIKLYVVGQGVSVTLASGGLENDDDVFDISGKIPIASTRAEPGMTLSRDKRPGDNFRPTMLALPPGSFAVCSERGNHHKLAAVETRGRLIEGFIEQRREYRQGGCCDGRSCQRAGPRQMGSTGLEPPLWSLGCAATIATKGSGHRWQLMRLIVRL